MHIERVDLYAVLTGDLVKSSRLSPEQSNSAMQRLRQLAKEFESTYPESTIGRLDTFRHDSWQWLLAKPELALRAAVFMRAGLRAFSEGRVKFDTRIAIGTGAVETIAKQRISDSRGPAFVCSGRALDAMKNESRLAYAADNGIAAEEWLAGGLVPLLDCIVTDWTPTEARAVYGTLMGWTQEEIAEKWPILSKTGKRQTRQAVWDSLSRAHRNTIQETLEFVEKRMKATSGGCYA